MRDLAPAAALLVAGLTGLGVASLSGDEGSGQYLVITAPWSSRGETIALIGAAEGGLLELGGFPNIVVAASLDTDFARRAREAGAWLVLPSPGLAGCFGARTEISLP